MVIFASVEFLNYSHGGVTERPGGRLQSKNGVLINDALTPTQPGSTPGPASKLFFEAFSQKVSPKIFFKNWRITNDSGL